MTVAALTPRRSSPFPLGLVAASLALTLLAGDEALAAPSWIPDFEPERRLYVVPPAFEPPTIGRAGLERLDAALRATHYPFYVVVLERLPEGPGDDDARAQAVTDGLAEAWSMEGADPAVTSYFALTFDPRKYSLLVGARWKTELGLEGAALDPFIDRFTARVRGTPVDPAGGIADLVRDLDEYAYERADPARLAARRLEDRRAATRRLRDELRHALAAPPELLPWDTEPYREAADDLAALADADDDTLGALDLGPFEVQVRRLRDQIAAAQAEAQRAEKARADARWRLRRSIEEGRTLLADEHAPADTATYRDALAAAEAALAGTDPERQREARDDLEGALTLLRGRIRANAEAEAERLRTRLTLALGALGALLVLFALARRVGAQRRRARERLDDDLAAWEAALAQVDARYRELFGAREGVLGLLALAGRTRELSESVAREVDALLATIRGMEGRVRRCRADARRRWISAADVEALREALGGRFEIDPREIDEGELLRPPIERITVDPATFDADLEVRFAAALAGWSRLAEVSERALRPSAERFPHERLDAVLAQLDDVGVTHGWVADHPLIGDASADAELYATADSLRWTDPVAYAERLDALEAAEDAVVGRTERLIDARRRIDAARDLPIAPSPPGLILDPADDPSIAAARARSLVQVFEARLASPPAHGPIDITAVLEAAEAALAALTRAREFAAAVHDALADATALVEVDAPRALGDAARALAAAEDAASEARRVHADVDVDGWIGGATEALRAAAADLDEARVALAERRLVRAHRRATGALERAVEARLCVERVHLHVADLDAARQRYEARIREVPQIRARRQANLTSYGSHAVLQDPVLPTIHGPAIYGALNRDLERTLDSWEAIERVARQAAEVARAAAEDAAIARDIARIRAESGLRAMLRDVVAATSGPSRHRVGSSSRSGSTGGSSSRAGSWGGSSRSSSRSGSW